MSIRRMSVLLPCNRLDDFPTHLEGNEAADLLAAWTSLWHPALIAQAQSLPTWHSTDDLPDPSELEGELVVIPSASRRQMSGDWTLRLQDSVPRNPPPVEATASRANTVAAVLQAAHLDTPTIASHLVDDFLALGHAHLQVELLTRAMRYMSVLDTDQFDNAAVAAAKAAVAGESEAAAAELGRAFDLLSDARNHVYAVDFYVIDLTLVAPSTIGESLRQQLSSAVPGNVLLDGRVLEQMAAIQPATLGELRRAVDSATMTLVGGVYRSDQLAHVSPEAMLVEFQHGQQVVQHLLGQTVKVFGQYGSDFSPRLPEVLSGLGFVGALHSSFDGGRLPKADQCKTWWGTGSKSSIQALATRPLDRSRPDTWLRLAESIAETIAHDHVATILLAGYPGTGSEYCLDLRRAARYSSVLGKIVTLEEYFAISREPDEWTTFHPNEYPRAPRDAPHDPISSGIGEYQRDVLELHDRLARGMAAAVGLPLIAESPTANQHLLALNPWNFRQTVVLSTSSPRVTPVEQEDAGEPLVLRAVPGCGFASVKSVAEANDVLLAVDRTLRNETLEVTVSAATGGIQSVRKHRDRSTRLSQRLVFHEDGMADAQERSQMIAESVEITRNGSMLGEITSHGLLQSATGDRMATYRQAIRLTRGSDILLIAVQLEPLIKTSGALWHSYYASRIAWRDEAIGMRYGRQWIGRQSHRAEIESPEWVEIDDGIGTILCLPRGLPFHRRSGPAWLDSLLIAADESQRSFRFAISLDNPQPLQAGIGLLAAERVHYAHMAEPLNSPKGWFLHIGAKNVLLTHLEPLAAPRAGIRVRLQETAGQETSSLLAAFKPFRVARSTDFRGQLTGVLSVHDGRVEFDIAASGWIQIEAEW